MTCTAMAPPPSSYNLIHLTILVQDVMTWKVGTRPFSRHTTAIFCISFSSNGKQIASGSGDTTIQIWDVQMADALISPLNGGTSSVMSVAFSGDGWQIVYSSVTLRVWNVKSGRLFQRFWEQHDMFFKYVTFSLNRTRIVSATSSDHRKQDGLINHMERDQQ